VTRKVQYIEQSANKARSRPKSWLITLSLVFHFCLIFSNLPRPGLATAMPRPARKFVDNYYFITSKLRNRNLGAHSQSQRCASAKMDSPSSALRMIPPHIFSKSERSYLTMLISKSALEGCQDWSLKSIISNVLKPHRNDQARDYIWRLLGLFHMLPRYDRRPKKQYLYLAVNHVLIYLRSICQGLANAVTRLGTFSSTRRHRI
jgi:hypothetical protein